MCYGNGMALTEVPVNEVVQVVQATDPNTLLGIHFPSVIGGSATVLTVIGVLWKLSQKRTDQLLTSKDRQLERERDSNKNLQDQVLALERDKDRIEEDRLANYKELMHEIIELKQRPMLNGMGDQVFDDVEKILAEVKKISKRV